MASTMVALQTVTVGAGGASTITFSSIPQTYTDLVVKISARVTTGDFVNISYRYNSSSVSYSGRGIYGTGSNVASYNTATTENDIFLTPSSAQTANTFSNQEIYIPNYTGSNSKSSSVDSAGETNNTTSYSGLLANLWSNASPVTSLTIFTSSSSFIQYSTFTLYGVYKDAAETTPAAPTIGTATAGSQAADVAFTPAGSGAPASSYVVTSSPGGLTATGGSSPIQIGGLTSGTAYTFTVRGQNPGGLGAASAASNSVTPYDGYESIATIYPVGSSSVTFSSIASTFKHLQVRIYWLNSANSNNWFRLNGDTGANYAGHELGGDGSSAYTSAYSSNSEGILVGYASTSTSPGVAVVDILDYADTNKFKTTRTLSGQDRNGSGLIAFRSSLWRSTSAVNSLSFYAQSGTFTAGSVIELYGIR